MPASLGLELIRAVFRFWHFSDMPGDLTMSAGRGRAEVNGAR
jgi:hypothetical protein